MTRLQNKRSHRRSLRRAEKWGNKEIMRLLYEVRRLDVFNMSLAKRKAMRER